MRDTVSTAGAGTIVHVLVTYRAAGTEMVSLELLRGAVDEGWNALVVIPPAEALDELAGQMAASGIRVERIGPLFESERSPLKNLVALIKLFRSVRADIVHFHIPWAPVGYEAILAGWLARVPVRLRTDHNPIGSSGLSLPQRAKMFILDLLIHRIVCVSSMNRQRHIDAGRPRDKLDVVPNGIRISRVRETRNRRETRSRHSLPDDKLLAVIVGALEERKGVLDFVRAAVHVEDDTVEFVVVGAGGLRDDAERLASDLGVRERFHFLGSCDDAPDIMRACDIYVQPSHFEGLSVAMLEALAVGLPMVTTEVDGVQDVLSGSIEVPVVPVGATQALGEEIAILAGNESQRRLLGAALQDRVVSEFTVAHMQRNYFELYAELQSA